ncbi:MAG: long-chain-acyl-CoA synthetase [Solirubrobacteraceae bacterium]
MLDYKEKKISFFEIATSAIKLIPDLPKIIRGFYYAKFLAKDSVCGLAKMFEEAVRNNPKGNALLYNNQSFTYEELDLWSNKIANTFINKGLQKGDTISIFLENRPEFIALVLGAAKIGVGMALINTSQKGKVLIHSFNLLKPKLIFFGEELATPFNEIRNEIEIQDKDIYYLPDNENLNEQIVKKYNNFFPEIEKNKDTSLSHLIPTIKGDTPLFFIFTSGTTGLPKATIYNNRREQRAYGLFGLITSRLKKNDIMYIPLPMFHATGLSVGWGSVLAGYATLALDRSFSASNFWKRIKHYKATSLCYVGELCNYILMQPECEEEKNNTLKKVIGNGMRMGIWGKFKKRYKIEQIAEFYASSEGNVAFSNIFNLDYTVGFGGVPFSIIKYDRELEKPILGKNGFMEEVNIGEVGLLIGEISLKSPFDGYTSKESSEKAILKNVFKQEDAYFNTGDLVRNQGFKHVQFVDRTGDTYRWKGENVSTSEIENIMMDHKQIKEAIVYGVEIPGCNGRAGMANITLEDNENNDFSNILNYLNGNCPKFAVPLFFRITNLETVNTTMTLKYAKSTLKDAAFYLDKVGVDKVYVLLPNESNYHLLTPEIEAKINNKEIKF